MHPFKMIFGGIGLGLAVLSVQVLSSTVADARSYHGSYHRYYGYRTHYREYNIPNAYRTGSFNWWQEMDRQGRGGRK
jgi:hypothetical protein